MEGGASESAREEKSLFSFPPSNFSTCYGRHGDVDGGVIITQNTKCRYYCISIISLFIFYSTLCLFGSVLQDQLKLL
jgi:hypothetical protein